MNFSSKLLFCLSLSYTYIFTGNQQSIEIKQLEIQALKKLTQQLVTKTPADISPELLRLDEIAVQQAQERADSLQSATTIVGAAMIGALLAQSTQSSWPQTRAAYKLTTDNTIAPVSTETSKFVTGLESPALLSIIPSFSTLLSGGIALGGLFALYEIHRAIHAPCRAKFTLAEHKWGHQLKLIREHTEKTIAKHEEMNHNHQETFTVLQESHSDLEASLASLKVETAMLKENQMQINNRMISLGGSLLEIKGSLQSMSKQAHWDIDKFGKSAPAPKDAKRKPILAHTPPPQTTPFIDNGAGVGFLRNQTSQAPLVRTVDEVGYFGCLGHGKSKKVPTLQ